MTAGIQPVNLDTPEDLRFLEYVTREQRYFDDPEDTALLWRGVRRASTIAEELGMSRRLLDLGSGVSLVTSLALAQGVSEAARAIEVNADAVQRGKELATQLGIFQDRDRYDILCGDVETALPQQTSEAFRPTIVAGNLPYLPQRLSIPDSTRDAGTDGTRFIEILLSYAKLPSVQLVTHNMCSMTTPDRVFELFTDHDLHIDSLFAFKTTFGHRTNLLLDQGILDRDLGQYFHISQDGIPYQVIMNLVMSRGRQRNASVAPEQVLEMLANFSKTGQVTQGRSL
jgi:hypothetical protein